MPDTPDKPKVIPIYHPYKQLTRLRTRRWLNISIVVIVIIAAILSSILITNHARKSHQAAIQRNVRLVYVDPAKGRAALVSGSGDVLANAKLAKGSYVTYETSAPDGTVLLALNAPSPLESFVMLGGTARELPAKVAKALRTADYQGGSHHFVFTDSQNVSFITCGSGHQTCKLVSLDLSSGKSRTILDTGLAKRGSVSYCYLLGDNQSGSSLYLRVNGKSSLSHDTSAVYHLNAATGKVLNKTIVPTSAGYSLAMAPDGQTLIYTALTFGNKQAPHTTLHLTNVASGKDATVNWTNIGIPDQSGSLQWSPDSTKVLLRTGTIRLPAGSKQTPVPVYMAYLDTAKKQVIGLQSVSTAKNDIAADGWLDDNTIVYDELVAAKPGDFSTAKDQIYTQDVSTKTIGQFGGAQGSLLAVIY